MKTVRWVVGLSGVIVLSQGMTALANPRSGVLKGDEARAQVPAANSQAAPLSPDVVADRSSPADRAEVSTQAADLGAPILKEPDPPSTLETAQFAPAPSLRLSPLERPFTQLFGFETATPLQAKELVLSAGGTSFNNPNDFRAVAGGDDNRSNDIRFGAAYGITDQVQFSIGVFGKDDTIFTNLVRDNSDLQLIYGGVPVQLKWRFYDQNRLSSALVVGAEFPFQTVPESAISGSLGGINPRQLIFGVGGSSRPLAENALLAVDNTPYFSVAVPVSYRVAPKARLHLNPQVSVFPETIEVRATRGDVSALEAANIGLEGDRLNYYGTVAGIGLGFDYSFTPRLQFAADVTPVVLGRNSVGSGEDSLFVTRPVWNAGLRFAPSSRLGINLYATNRFGPVAAAPSNLLAQPGGNWGVGVDFVYLPDVTGAYAIETRETYPEAAAFLSLPMGFPSAMLPLSSILYQLGTGSSGRVAPTVRVGLLDDFELAVGGNRGSTEQLQYEGFVLGRLALVPDRGQAGFSAAIGFGASVFESSINSTEFGLYAELPLSYRFAVTGLNLNVTPKVAVPVQALGVDPILGISLGTTWSVARNTQLLAQVTPIVTGDNQLQDNPVPGQLIALQGRSLLYSVGVRQLFPSGNSLYALDLYFGNSVADTGLQGLSALPAGDTQFGLRFSVLNGVPGL